MKRLFPVMLLLAVFVFGAAELSAKPLSKIIGDIGLTPDDYTMLSA